MTVSLPRLRGDNPLAYLVALGILGLVIDDDAVATLAWTRDGPLHIPEFSSVLAGSREELVDYLADRLEPDERLVAGWLRFDAKDLNALTVGGLRERLAESEGKSDERIVTSLAAEVPIKPPRGRRTDGPTIRSSQAARTPFCMAMFNIHSGFIQAAVRQANALTRDDIEACLQWRHERGVTSLNLDPAARAQVRALMAQEPTEAGPSGVPAAIPIAVRGIAFYPLAPRRREPTPPQFPPGRGFRWPVWTQSLPAQAIRPLVAAPFLDGAASSQLRAHGIDAVYEADVEPFTVRNQPLTRFKWGRQVA